MQAGLIGHVWYRAENDRMKGVGFVSVVQEAKAVTWHAASAAVVQFSKGC